MNPLEQVISIFFENGKTSFAIKILDEASEFVNAPEQYFVLGHCYYKVAQYDSAIKYLKLCVEQKKDYELYNNALFKLAMSYADKMDTENALQCLDKLPKTTAYVEIRKEVEKRHRENKHIQETGFWTDHSHHLHSQNLAEWLIKKFNKNDVIADFGCGRGFYLNKLKEAKFKNLTGYEGAIPENKYFENIIQQDLTKPFKIAQSNIICLEVAEHIPSAFSSQFLTNIKENCDGLLVMSWAVRGQMGIGHVNCKNNDEAIQTMANYGFEFLPHLTIEARNIITEECSWFKQSLLVFKKIS